MRSHVRLATIMAAMFVTVALAAQEPGKSKPKPAPEEQTGLRVGEKAPRFVLKDQDGQERKLDEFLEKGKVALVFYRSADW